MLPCRKNCKPPPAAAISASLSLFLAGFAFAQLLWGPLSDRLGRKPVLLLGLTLFALGCLGMLWVRERHLATGAALYSGRGRLCRGRDLAGAGDRPLSGEGQAQTRIFATIMPLVGLSPALAPLLGAWLLNHAHFDWQAIFATLLAITLLLMLPALMLKERAKTQPTAEAPKNGVSFWRLLKSPVFSGNVLMYAACSASFFAWLTGSPFILHDMGYGPATIGLSYVPQTIAFLVGGYGCRAALKRNNGKTMLPWLLVAYGVSMVALYLVATLTAPTLTTLLIPFCVMALANGASYPIVVAQALMPFPESSGKAAALQNTLQLGLCFLASLVVSALIAQPLLTTTTVMVSTVILAALGYFLQRGKAVDAQQKAQREHANSAS